MIDGNTAAALGCVYAGATVGAWYPITPSTSLMDAFKGFCEQIAGRSRRRGRKNYIMIQAEDELASIGMVIGAQLERRARVHRDLGPGPVADAGIPRAGLLRRGARGGVRHPARRTRPPACRRAPSRAICSSAAYASHGDTRQVCLYPANPEECFEFAAKAFDLAERLQTPVLVLSDLDIGMNDWMCPEFKWDQNYRPDRGKVLDAEQLAKTDQFWRYYDHDNDGIPQRTLPGVHPQGRLLHARLGSQPVRRATPRIRRNTRSWSTGCARNGSPPRGWCPGR